MQVLATKNFMRFARNFGCGTQALWEAVHDIPDADLGGCVFKFRLAREGQGRSGGARAIVAMKHGQRIVLMYGFEKKDRENIRKDELKAFQASAKIYLQLPEDRILDLLSKQTLIEIRPSKTPESKLP